MGEVVTTLGAIFAEKPRTFGEAYPEFFYGARYDGAVGGDWKGESLKPLEGLRGSVPLENAKWARDTLKALYPKLSQAQIDNAAWKAHQKVFASSQSPRANQKWGDKWMEEVLPTDIVRGVAAELGGLPSGAEAQLAGLDQKFAERADKIKSTIKSQDKANSGISGLLNSTIGKLGPIGEIALAVATGGNSIPITAGLRAAGSLEDGDIKGAAVNGAIAAMGATGVNPLSKVGDAAANSVGAATGGTVSRGVTGALTSATGAAIMGGDIGKAATIGGAAGVAGSLAQDAVGSDYPELGKAAGTVASGLTAAAANGLLTDSNPTSKTKGGRTLRDIFGQSRPRTLRQIFGG